MPAAGYRIRILPGSVQVPVYWESKYGTASAPILVQAETHGTVRMASANIYNVRYLYLVGLRWGACSADGGACRATVVLHPCTASLPGCVAACLRNACPAASSAHRS